MVRYSVRPKVVPERGDHARPESHTAEHESAIPGV